MIASLLLKKQIYIPMKKEMNPLKVIQDYPVLPDHEETMEHNAKESEICLISTW